MRGILTLILVALSVVVYAQQSSSWLPFYTGDISAYKIRNANYDHSDMVMWFNYQDTVIGNATHYLGKKKIRLPFIDRFDSSKTYEMGLNLRLDNSLFEFDNIDSIHLKINLRNTQLRDTILVATQDSSTLFYGIVLRKYEDVYFGIRDSLLAIRLIPRGGFTGISSRWQNKDILLSKNYGWVYSPVWTFFPQDTTTAELASHNRLLNSPQVLTGASVYDFNVGDVFHYQYFEMGSTNRQTIRKVLSRTESATSISYVFLDSVRTNFSRILEITQPRETYQKNQSWGIPTYASSDIIGIYSSQMDLRDSLPTVELFEFYYPSPRDTILDGTMPSDSYTYRKGLGLWYYYSRLYSIQNRTNYLAYYKKGNSTWGTPFVLSNKEELESSSLVVYPNPTNGFLHFGGLIEGKAYHIQVYSLDGKLIVDNLPEINTLNSATDFSALNAGHYCILLRDNINKVIATRIIQKQ